MEESSRFQGVPDILYGTAFKSDDTAVLVEAALNAGFRAIDTAANKPQYRESQVGEGIAAALSCGFVKRSDLYVCALSCLTQISDHVGIERHRQLTARCDCVRTRSRPSFHRSNAERILPYTLMILRSPFRSR